MVTKAKGGKKKGSASAIAAALGAPDPDPEVKTESEVERDASVSNVPEPRQKLVKKWQEEIRADKYYFDKVWKRMREDMEYARLGATKEWVDGDNYTVPITNRFINQAVSSLFAKNPKAEAKRKEKLLYTAWDGTQATAQAALQLVQSGADQDGQAAAILQDVKQAQGYDQLMTRMGKTLTILFHYFTGEDFPDFKIRMKSCVRRTKTTGVGWCELQYHRALEADPDITARIGDMTEKLGFIQAKQADLKDKIIDADSTEAAELEQALKTLEEEKMKIVSEGLMFDFPRSTDIIPHRAVTQLAGLIGADYVTREYLMTADEIEEKFKKDVRSNYKVYVEIGPKEGDTRGGDQEGDRAPSTDSDMSMQKTGKSDKKGKACVWRVFDKKRREELWLCEGYPDYLREPAAPEVQVPGFWTIYPLIFNEVEDEKEVYPPSDVHFLKHPQREYNNAREGIREHRRANRPKYFVKAGALEEDEKRRLESAPPHAVIELKGIEGQMTIEQLIQPYKGVPIDPNLYETASIMKDILYGVGAQSADMGQTGDATATESNIAEQSRMSTLSSNVDDLDEFLSMIARASGHIMLQEMSKDTVVEVVGPGAVWPELDPQTIAKELFLEIKAGSTGRPNQQAELAALERGMTFLIQLGGISGTVIAKKYAYLLDIDEDELIVEGMPSITALNAMAQQKAQAQNQAALQQQAAGHQMVQSQQTAGHQVLLNHQTAGHAAKASQQEAAAGVIQAHAGQPPAGPAQPGTGNPATNPAEQGAAGASNMPQGPGASPQGQPAYPAAIHRYSASGARIH